MKQSLHLNERITDYVLGLVSEDESREIARHLTHCRECQQALNQERQVGLAVREAIFQIPQPDNQQLGELMPPFPQKQTFPLFGLNWQPRFALVGFLLILILGTLSLQTQLRKETWLGTSPAIYSTAALVTDTPTLTLSATKEGPEPLDTAIPTPAARNPLPLPHPAIVPVPAAPILR
jgi:hypothetical protein